MASIYLWLHQEHKTYLCLNSWACKYVSPNPMLLCGRIFLGVTSLRLCGWCLMLRNSAYLSHCRKSWSRRLSAGDLGCCRWCGSDCAPDPCNWTSNLTLSNDIKDTGWECACGMTVKNTDTTLSWSTECAMRAHEKVCCGTFEDVYSVHNLETSHVVPWQGSIIFAFFWLPCQESCLFGKACVHILWNFSWGRNNRPISFLMAEVPAQSLSWLSMWRLLLQLALTWLTPDCLEFLSKCRCWLPQSVDGFELSSCTRSPKPTSQRFPCQALSHQCQSILLCQKYSCLWLAQFRLQVLSFGTCRSVNFATRSAKPTQAVSGWPCLKVLPTFQSFCVICTITQSNELCLSCNICLFDNCIGRCLIKNLPEDALCCLCTSCWQATFNCWCSCWEVVCNRKPSIIWEVVCNKCWARTIEAESGRLSRSSWFTCPRWITNSIKHTDVTGWTNDLHRHLLTCGSCADVHVFAFSLQFSFLGAFASFHDWMFLHKIHFRNLSCKFVQFFSGLSVSFQTSNAFWTWTNFHEAPKLHFPKKAASCRSVALPPFGSCEETGTSLVVPMRTTRCG